MLHEYDPRDLQRKALERWEKQQQTWSKIEQRLQTQRLFSQHHSAQNSHYLHRKEECQREELEGSNNKKKELLQRKEIGRKHQSTVATHNVNSNSNSRNATTILHAPTEDRKRREANEVICMANSSTNSTGKFIWEHTLRCSSNDVSNMRRSVSIGKTTYPYILYGQVSSNENTTTPSGLAVTRIIHSDEVSESEAEGKCNRNENNYGNTFPQPSSKTSRVREKLQNQLTSNYVADEYMDVQRKAESYIAQHSHSLEPAVKSQMAYLTKPRHFLQVVGHATPVKVNGSPAHVAEESGENTSNSSTRKLRAASPQMEWMESVQQETPLLQHKNEESTINDSETNKDTGAEVASECANADNLPFLSLSSRRLTFYAKPSQLVHQTLEVENTSSVTVYYTMTPIDTWQEIIEEEKESEKEEHYYKENKGVTDKREQLSDEERKDQEQLQTEEVNDGSHSDTSELLSEHAISSTLHTLAEHHTRCVKFFYLSNESNGVIYPMSSVQFAFSLRSPRAGRFRQTYELLTVPASSTRILIELIGMVPHSEVPMPVLTSHLHTELEHKATVNTQRQMVRGIINAPEPYEAAELESAIMSIHTATKEQEAAERATIEQHRQLWDEANGLNMCDIPFNRQVYDALTDLHKNVCSALAELSCPLPCTTWDGSVSQLIGLLSLLRDNALRELVYDGVMVLLRASRVSLDENEPLQRLLHRAAIVCVLEDEQRCVLAHSDTILDWQTKCEDEILNKLEVLHSDITSAQVNTSQSGVNKTNARKSRSISPPSTSMINAGNINNTKPVRGDKLSRVNVNNNNINNNINQMERNASRSDVMPQTASRSPSTTAASNKVNKSRKTNENVDTTNEDKFNDEKSNNDNLLNNDTNVNSVLGLRQEYETLMSSFVCQQIQKRESRVHDLLCRFREVVEVCCSLPLLHVVHAVRAHDIARIQSAMEIEVDTTNPALVASSMMGIFGSGATMTADGMNTKGNVNNSGIGSTSGRTSKRR